MNAATQYLSDFGKRFGDGWNRFWYAPIDPLPTSVLRIGVGSVAFYLIALFSLDLMQLFGSHGLLPTESVTSIYAQLYRFSYFDAIEDGLTLRAAHYAGLAVLAAYTVGLWTRITSVLSLIVFLSYFHRARMLTSEAEPVIAMLLFYLCFAPSGKYLSVDAWLRRRRTAQAPQTYSPQRNSLAGRSFAAAVSIRLIQTHLSLIYFLMFVATMQRNIVWWNGTAVWWLIARTETAMIDLTWLANYPYVINLWTTSIVVFYIAFAIFIWNRTSRPLLIALSAPFWLGLALISGLGPFCWAMFTAGLAFVSAEQWRACCSGCCPNAVGSSDVVPLNAKGS